MRALVSVYDEVEPPKVEGKADPGFAAFRAEQREKVVSSGAHSADASAEPAPKAAGDQDEI